jgi:hypothetical protein
MKLVFTLIAIVTIDSNFYSNLLVVIGFRYGKDSDTKQASDLLLSKFHRNSSEIIWKSWSSG